MKKLMVLLGFFSCIASGGGCRQTPPANPSPQANASFIPATGQTFYLDLDTAEGVLSEWRHADLKGLCALHASIRVLRLRTDLKWVPTFSIWLVGEVGDKRNTVGIQFWAKDRKAPLDVRVVQFEGPKLVGVRSSNIAVELDASVPVQVAWPPGQPITISIGENETHSVNVSWRVEHIAITASTGEMKVDPLVLGCIGEMDREPQTGNPASQGASVAVISGSAGAQVQGTPPTGNFITSFERETLKPVRKDPNIGYDLDPSRERFFVHVPATYSEYSRYGLVVFIHAGDEVNGLPDGWPGILDARKFVFIAPENAGNEQNRERRLGLGVLSALEIMKHYHIDANRVYVSGFSGGARMAGLLGFFQSDVFRGTIQNCGADFYELVPQVKAASQLDTAGKPYGFFSATADEVHEAKKRVRFVLITGSNDFRQGNILDIFDGGFAKAGFQARLFDVPGMGHDIADPRTLNAALDFLETRD